jgi:DNA-binding NtrC family response regulator
MSEKILLVDDEKDFLDVMSERIEARGMDVTTADSAEKALKDVESGGFDAIILDLMMPGMDGLQTLKAIKKKNPDLQVILLTGHATVEKGIEAMKLGAMDFLEKPADLDKLTEIIKKAQARKMVIIERKMEEKMKQIIGTKGWEPQRCIKKMEKTSPNIMCVEATKNPGRIAGIDQRCNPGSVRFFSIFFTLRESLRRPAFALSRDRSRPLRLHPC